MHDCCLRPVLTLWCSVNVVWGYETERDVLLRMMIACIQADPGKLEAELPNGLIMGHAYSITGVKLVTSLYLVLTGYCLWITLPTIASGYVQQVSVYLIFCDVTQLVGFCVVSHELSVQVLFLSVYKLCRLSDKRLSLLCHPVQCVYGLLSASCCHSWVCRIESISLLTRRHKSHHDYKRFSFNFSFSSCIC